MLTPRTHALLSSVIDTLKPKKTAGRISDFVTDLLAADFVAAIHAAGVAGAGPEPFHGVTIPAGRDSPRFRIGRT